MDFDTEDYRQDETKQQYMKRIMGDLQRDVSESFGTNIDFEIDEGKIDKLVSFGYPREYIINSLQEFLPNYLTAGYYLL